MLRAQGDAARPLLASAGYSHDAISEFSRRSNTFHYIQELAHAEVSLTRVKQYELAFQDQLAANVTLEARAMEARAREAQARDAYRIAEARLSLDPATGLVNDNGQGAGSADITFDNSASLNALHADISDPAYSRAHPNGAAANCASCHK